jgi:large-conductance mechanosensitive channel
MENPRTINRFYLGLLVTYVVLAVAESIWLGDVSVLLDAIAVLAVIFGSFALATVVNFIFLAPFVWLMARFVTGKTKGGNSGGGEQGN